MANININEELIRAVEEQDLKKVKALLAVGGTVLFSETYNGETALHRTRNAEIAKELLLRGANVNATNKYRETPLDRIANNGRDLDVARVFLRYGADVDAVNRRGNTPLNQAIKYAPNFELVKELLKHGADINIRNKKGYTPLDYAVKLGMTYSKLLIKFTVLNKFREINNKVVNLDAYITRGEYTELSNYLYQCFVEVHRMRIHEIFGGFSLYKIIKKKIQNNVLYKKISQTDFSEHYPIYNDIILDMVKERKDILDKLNGIQIYTNVDAPSEDVKGKKIILDYYSTYNICQYLSNNDLLNLMDIFEDLQVPLRNNHNEELSEELNEDLNEKLDEALPTHDSKRARIE